MSVDLKRRKTFVILLACAILVVAYFTSMRVLFWRFFLDSPGSSGSSTQYHWLKNPTFTTPAITYESGTLTNSIVELAPDNWYWGLRGYTWGNGLHPIEECSFKVYKAGTNDYNVILQGRDGTNRWAVCTLIQGWVWGGNSPANWYKPYPIRVESFSQMNIEAWVYQKGGPHPHPRLDWWKNCLFDIWMKDENGKILMIDIYFSGGGMDWWTENEYHMAYTATSVPSGVWSHVKVEVKSLIEEGISRAASVGIMLDVDSLKLYQAEVLLELKNAWGYLDVGLFQLTYYY